MTAEIVQIPKPNLNDIPERLRWLADKIEADKTETVFVIIPQVGDFPKLFGFGDVTGTSDPIVQLELVKHWLLTNLVTR